MRVVVPNSLSQRVLQPVGDDNLALLTAHRGIERLDRLDDAIRVFRADSSEHYRTLGHACLFEIGAAAVRRPVRVEAYPPASPVAQAKVKRTSHGNAIKSLAR